MMYHALYFLLTTTIGYACFFNQTLHSVCLAFCCLFAIAMGGVTLVKDISRPCHQSLERVNSLIATLA